MGLLLCGALSLALVASRWDDAAIGWELARNLAGFSGLAFLGARFLGGGISWVVPLGYGIVALLVESRSRWAWPGRIPEDRWSISVAVALIVVGLVVVTFGGSRATGDDRHS